MKLMYATRTGTSWETEIVKDNWAGFNTSIALTPDDSPRIACHANWDEGYNLISTVYQLNPSPNFFSIWGRRATAASASSARNMHMVTFGGVWASSAKAAEQSRMTVPNPTRLLKVFIDSSFCIWDSLLSPE